MNLIRIIKYKYLDFRVRKYSNTHLKPPWKLLFFGADNFSLTSLKALCEEYRNGNLISTLRVVTSIKPNQNPVHKFAIEEKLHLYDYPLSVPQREYDIGLVVSFGHLIPETIINSFPLGMLNIHASLLPRWRGAAPIIYALANGDTETGITIMRIKPKHFDRGDIIAQVPVKISNNTKMPELYSQLAVIGARTLMEVLKGLPNSLERAREQSTEGITLAPKIKSNFAKVLWEKMTSRQVYNLYRALVSLYPLTTTWNGATVKLHEMEICEKTDCCKMTSPGSFSYDKHRKKLRIKCADDRCVLVDKITIKGKTMSAQSFRSGYLKNLSQNEFKSFD